MVVDILDYTDEQLDSLSQKQRLLVYTAQAKKNRLENKLKDDIKKEWDNVLKNGTFHSPIYKKAKEELEKRYNMEVEILKEKLRFDLVCEESSGGSDSVTDVPYVVDYELTYDERYIIVRDYYVNNYASPMDGYNAFLLDDFAVAYLGDLYSTLFDYLYLRAYA